MLVIAGRFKEGVVVPDVEVKLEDGAQVYIVVPEEEEDYKYRFRDPVHGFIRITAKEKQLIDHPYFQRLRRIKQLGVSHYIYHGAIYKNLTIAWIPNFSRLS